MINHSASQDRAAKSSASELGFVGSCRFRAKYPFACLGAKLYNAGEMITIEPVHKSKRRQAMRHLVAGEADLPDLDLLVDAFLQLVEDTGLPNWFWQARGAVGLEAVALVASTKGRVGFLYHSPVGVAGVNNESLVKLLREVIAHCLDGRVGMVQALLEERQLANIPILLQAGMEKLADLVYMQKSVAACNAPASPGQWEFRNYHQFAESELMDVMRQTYRDSQDCPRLVGARPIEDVLASHKESGLFTPQSWWIVYRESRPAGCLLMNQSHDMQTGEIVYMGVEPEFRGQGLGLTLLSHAGWVAGQMGLVTMRLAVDVDNWPAKRLYEQFGFNKTQQKQAFSAFPRQSINTM